MIMAAAKALAVVNRWEVGEGDGEEEKGFVEKEDDAQKKRKRFKGGHLIF